MRRLWMQGKTDDKIQTGWSAALKFTHLLSDRKAKNVMPKKRRMKF